MNLLDALLAAVCLTAALTVTVGMRAQIAAQDDARTCAWQVEAVSRAALRYAEANRDSLLPGLTQAEGRDLTVRDLAEAGYLEAGFPEEDIFGQPFAVFLRRGSDDPASPLYAAIRVATFALGAPARGGRSGSMTVQALVQAKTLPAVRRIPGAGYVPAREARAILGAEEGELYVPGTRERISMAGLGAEAPGEGSIGLVHLTDYGLRPDVLHRKPVPGHPELNAMAQDLDMGNHAVTGVTAIQLTPIGERTFYYGGVIREGEEALASLCAEDGAEGLTFLDAENGIHTCRGGQPALVQDTGNAVQVKRIALVRNGDGVEKPACTAGLEPRIFAAPASTGTATGSGGSARAAISAFATWTDEEGDNRWRVHHRLASPESDTATLDEDAVRILVITACVHPDMRY